MTDSKSTKLTKLSTSTMKLKKTSSKTSQTSSSNQSTQHHQPNTVRVVVRIRPINQNDDKKLYPHREIKLNDDTVTIQTEAQTKLNTRHAYSFDNVFHSTTTQEEIYNLIVNPIVHQFLDGYNATILAYGQTASGKTYTMGTATDPTTTTSELTEGTGMIYRAVDTILNLIHGTTKTIYASYLEIYNENLQDLLYRHDHDDDEGSNGRKIKRPEMILRQDPSGTVSCVNATKVPVTKWEHIDRLLRIGSRRRQTGSTLMNATSSRSHAIFTLNLYDDINQVNSKLHFVDLAGSERIKNTGAMGNRAKEGISINGGLLALGNVISALANPKQGSHHHIPFRESKLTRLLQGSIGGNAITTMIACVSPDLKDLNESLNTLRYASRAKKIKVAATIVKDPDSITSLQKLVSSLREEIHQLQEGRRRNTSIDIGVEEDDDRRRDSSGTKGKRTERDSSHLPLDSDTTRSSPTLTTTSPINHDPTTKLLTHWVQRTHQLENELLRSKHRYASLQLSFTKYRIKMKTLENDSKLYMTKVSSLSRTATTQTDPIPFPPPTIPNSKSSTESPLKGEMNWDEKFQRRIIDMKSDSLLTNSQLPRQVQSPSPLKGGLGLPRISKTLEEISKLNEMVLHLNEASSFYMDSKLLPPPPRILSVTPPSHHSSLTPALTPDRRSHRRSGALLSPPSLSPSPRRHTLHRQAIYCPDFPLPPTATATAFAHRSFSPQRSPPMPGAQAPVSSPTILHLSPSELVDLPYKGRELNYLHPPSSSLAIFATPF